jgi:hypothetical protein
MGRKYCTGELVFFNVCRETSDVARYRPPEAPVRDFADLRPTKWPNFVRILSQIRGPNVQI